LIGMRQSFDAQPDFEVIGSTTCPDTAVRLAATLQPDVAVLDMPARGMLPSAARRIAASCPEIRLVVLAASEHDDALREAASSAHGYALKSLSAAQLRAVTATVAGGGRYVAPDLTGNALEGTREAANSPVPLSRLTKRERAILQLVTRGLTNQEIGAQLNLAEKTVKHYLSSVLQKLGVRNRVEAALLAARSKRKRR
jgi:two-component system, NarL family, nitrate/nitrite response regulator NarL